jgi:hypothetical protein
LIQNERPFVLPRMGGVFACQGRFSGEQPPAGWAQGTAAPGAPGRESGVRRRIEVPRPRGRLNVLGLRQKVSGVVKRFWLSSVVAGLVGRRWGLGLAQSVQAARSDRLERYAPDGRLFLVLASYSL